jgi:multidrug efflux system membrane fusion protein
MLEGGYTQTLIIIAFCSGSCLVCFAHGLRLVDPGNVVQSNGATVLAVSTQMQPTIMIFTMVEDSLKQVRTRMQLVHTLPVEAWNRSQTTKIAVGKLQTIDNQIDTTTGTVKLRVLFDNKDDALYPNQFVNTRLLVNTLDGLLCFPLQPFNTTGR